MQTEPTVRNVGVARVVRDGACTVWWVPRASERAIAAMRELVAAGGFGLRERGDEVDVVGFERVLERPLSSWLPGDAAIDWRVACRLAYDLADALAWAEARDVFPGALSLDHITVQGDAPPRAVIACDDAPSVAVGASAVAAGHDSGKLSRWSAPEQAAGARWDHAANRYVLGLVLYRMLAGTHPFAGLGLRRALEQQASVGAPPLPEAAAAALPPGLHALVLRMLDADADRRPRHAAAIASRLRELLGEAATHPASFGAAVVSGGESLASSGSRAAALPAAASSMPAFAQPTSARAEPTPVAGVPTPANAVVRGGRGWWVLAALPLFAGVYAGRELSRDVTPPPSAAAPEVRQRAPLSSGETNPDDCATCHPDHTAQWHGSVMAHSVKSPLFQALEILIQEQGGREFGCEHGAGLLRPIDERTACRDRETGLAVTGSGGALWCVNCHAPSDNLERRVPPWNGLAAVSPSRRPLVDILSPAAMDGISCRFCHQVHGPVRPGDEARGGYEGNPDWVSTKSGIRFGARPEDALGSFGIGNSGYALDPRELLLAGTQAAAVPTGAHARPDGTAKAYLASSEFCGSCHDVRLFGTDAIGFRRGEHFKRLRNAYSEWRSWADDERRAGREPASCQDCHMSAFPGVCEPVDDAQSTLAQQGAGAIAIARACPSGTAFVPRPPGFAPQGFIATASGGPAEVAPHYFSGVDVPLADAFPQTLVDDPTLDAFGIPRGAKQRRDLLLGNTFRFELPDARRVGATVEIPVVLENVGAGHRVPAGFSQEREFWVHLVVRDDGGRVLYEVGRVDADDEDLRDKLFRTVNVDDGLLDAQGRPLGMFGADVVDGPDVPLWDPSPLTGATVVRGRGLINLQNGFLRCVTCIGEIDGFGRCQPGPGQGLHRADRFADGNYDADTGECISNLGEPEKFFETFFPVGALDATRGVLKAPDAIIDTRSAPPGVPLRFTYELPLGEVRGPISVEARLLFRAFPPFLVKAFADYEARMAARGERPGTGPLVTRAMLERLEVVELHRVRLSIP